jgi:Na+/H+ antiporter NhaD/arsenite permease-like protein
MLESNKDVEKWIEDHSSVQKRKKPIIIVLLFVINLFLLVVYVLSNGGLIQLVIMLTAIIGIFQMRRWGLYLYSAYFLIVIIGSFIVIVSDIPSHMLPPEAQLSFQQWITRNIIPVITIILSFYYRKQMS